MREEKEKKIDERCDNQEEDLEGWVVGWRTGTNYQVRSTPTVRRSSWYLLYEDLHT